MGRRGYVARLLMVLSICALLLAAGALAVQAQGSNLLQNPGFERPYVPMPVKENCRIAAPWVPYYYEGAPHETRIGYRLAPEYKAAFLLGVSREPRAFGRAGAAVLSQLRQL